MPFNVVYQPPRLPQQHLPRPRLSKALLGSSARVKLVCAPAGTGKTVLLNECLQQLDASAEIRWLRSSSHVNSATALSMQIAHALLLENDTDLIETLSNFNTPLHLVIDDFSPTADEHADALLARLVALSSPSIHWWISCRRPTKQFSRLVS